MNKIKIGQLIYQLKKENDKFHYDLGIVTEVYDNLIFVNWKYKKYISSISIQEIKDHLQEDEEGIIRLFKNGFPAFAKRNIFGKYKFN